MAMAAAAAPMADHRHGHMQNGHMQHQEVVDSAPIFHLINVNDPYKFAALPLETSPDQVVPVVLRTLQDLLGYAVGLTLASLECDHTCTVWEMSDANDGIRALVFALCNPDWSPAQAALWREQTAGVELRLGYGRVLATIMTGFLCAELDCFFPYVGFNEGGEISEISGTEEGGTVSWFRPWAPTDHDELCRAAVHFCNTVLQMRLPELVQCSPSLSVLARTRLVNVYSAAGGLTADVVEVSRSLSEACQSVAQEAVERARGGFFNAVTILQTVEEVPVTDALHVTLSAAANVLSASTFFVLFGEAYLLPGVDIVAADIVHCTEAIVQYSTLVKDMQFDPAQLERAVGQVRTCLVQVLDGLERYFSPVKKLYRNLLGAPDGHKSRAIKRAKTAVSVLRRIGELEPMVGEGGAAAANAREQGAKAADAPWAGHEDSFRTQIFDMLNLAYSTECDHVDMDEDDDDCPAAAAAVVDVHRRPSGLKRKMDDLTISGKPKGGRGHPCIGDSVICSDIMNDIDALMWDAASAPVAGPWLGTECLVVTSGDAATDLEAAAAAATAVTTAASPSSLVFPDEQTAREYVAHRLGAIKSRLVCFTEVVDGYLTHFELADASSGDDTGSGGGSVRNGNSSCGGGGSAGSGGGGGSPSSVTDHLGRAIDAHRGAMAQHHCPMCMWQSIFVVPDLTKPYNPSPYSLSRLNQ